MEDENLGLDELEMISWKEKRFQMWKEFDELMWKLSEKHHLSDRLKWRLFRVLCDYMEEHGM